ncbi:MAG: hypothetical protein QOC80_3047 [Frankiaceae bacterium]|nr:hypothetical protein [Frankiaceae bacterium]
MTFVLMCTAGAMATGAPMAAVGASTPAPGTTATTAYPPSVAIDPAVATNDPKVVRHPLRAQPHRSGPGKTALTNPAPLGYTPSQVRRYLGLSGTGGGQTVAVVTAFDAPNAESDLATFDRAFGLPAPPSFHKVDASGGTRYPRTEPGWALEAALDVQWVHAVAPAASILLVEAKSDALGNLLVAVDYAARQPGVTVISNSWGTSAEFAGQSAQDAHCALTTAVCVQATGDDGNPGGYPAYNPAVLAVGGTTLTLAADGTPTSEVGWSGSGGGVSTLVPRPTYQSSSPFPRRSIPDVSYDGDPATGVAVFSSTKVDKESGWFQMGGTSAGTPQWSGIVAVANGLRASNGKAPLVAVRAGGHPLHQALYGEVTRFAPPTLFDVISGSNGTCGAICSAQPSLDAVTGLGSPRRGIDVALSTAP